VYLLIDTLKAFLKRNFLFRKIFNIYQYYLSGNERLITGLNADGISELFYDDVHDQVVLRPSEKFDFSCYSSPPHIVDRYLPNPFSYDSLDPRTVYALMVYRETEDYREIYNFSEGETVVDIGAHVGFFSVWVSDQIGDSGTVLSIEPSPQNLKFLKQNISQNDVHNCQILEKGVWNDELTKRFASPSYVSGYHNPSVFHSDKEGFEAELSRLDEIIRNNDRIQTVDFIKMDIEGAEIEAIEGARRTFQKYRPTLAIATYHERAGERTEYKVSKLLNEFGYECEIVDQQESLTVARPY
jgi:FkbM family methyltransferase